MARLQPRPSLQASPRSQFTEAGSCLKKFLMAFRCERRERNNAGPNCSAWRGILSFLGQPNRGTGGQREREKRVQESPWKLTKERRWQGPSTDPPEGREWQHRLTQWHPKPLSLSDHLAGLPATTFTVSEDCSVGSLGLGAPREAGGKVACLGESVETQRGVPAGRP